MEEVADDWWSDTPVLLAGCRFHFIVFFFTSYNWLSAFWTLCLWCLTADRVPHTQDGAGAEVPGSLPRHASCGQTNRSVWQTAALPAPCWACFCLLIQVIERRRHILKGTLSALRHGHSERSYRQSDQLLQQRRLDPGGSERGRRHRDHQQRESKKLQSWIRAPVLCSHCCSRLWGHWLISEVNSVITSFIKLQEHHSRKKISQDVLNTFLMPVVMPTFVSLNAILKTKYLVTRYLVLVHCKLDSSLQCTTIIMEVYCFRIAKTKSTLSVFTQKFKFTFSWTLQMINNWFPCNHIDHGSFQIILDHCFIKLVPMKLRASLALCRPTILSKYQPYIVFVVAMCVWAGWGWSAGRVSGPLPVLHGRRPGRAHVWLRHGRRRPPFRLSRVLVRAERWECVWGCAGRLYGESPQKKQLTQFNSLTNVHPLQQRWRKTYVKALVGIFLKPNCCFQIARLVQGGINDNPTNLKNLFEICPIKSGKHHLWTLKISPSSKESPQCSFDRLPNTDAIFSF